MPVQEIQFTLNWKRVTVLSDPTRSLLKVLRDDLRLTGTKEGCGNGRCGSCTVLVDGKPVNSCVLPVSKVRGKEVVTIEGIGTIDNPHPIQRAFVECMAVQCGFCTPGMIMVAKALLDRNPHPTKEEIVSAFQRNLCRCTGYKKIIEAVEMASRVITGEAQASGEKPPTAGDRMLKVGVGESVQRLDIWEKVTGTAVYSADQYIEGMLHLKVLRSPHFHARIREIDTTAARQLPGVEAVFTAQDIPGQNRMKYFYEDFRLLADDKVRHYGEPVALVAAISQEIAKKALGLIKVDYEELEAIKDPFRALEKDAPKVHEDAESNLVYTQNLIKGDVEKGFSEADLIEENTYTTSMNEHAYLEPDAGVGHIDDEGRVVVRAATQGAHYMRHEISKVLGLPEDRVRVVHMTTGGAFGGRVDPTTQGFLALAAYKTGKPVKMVFTREEVFIGTVKRHPFYMRFKTGVTKDGRIVAHKADVLSDTGAYALAGPPVLVRAVMLSTGPYRIENVEVKGKTVYTNNTPCSAMRGFGAPQVTFAMESQIDRLAERLGIDPLEFREKNGYVQGSATASGHVLKDPPGYLETIRSIKPYWSKTKEGHSASAELKSTQVSERDHSLWRRGVGIASNWFGIGKTGLPNLSRAWVDLLPDGTILVRTGAADVGQGSSTTMAQIASEVLRQPLTHIKVICGDTLNTPDSDITCASKHTYFTGNATLAAARELRSIIMEQASGFLDEDESGLEFAEGVVRSAVTGKEVPLREIAGPNGLTGKGEYSASSDVVMNRETGQGVPYMVYTFGTTLADVDVNTETGDVKVNRVVVSLNVGKAMNPKSVEGQFEGGVVMGVGMALTERYVPGETRSFNQYKIPTIKDMPEIIPVIVEAPQSSGPLGAIGIGEPSQFPTTPAIINAIYDACGVRVSDLPVDRKALAAAIKAPKS